MGNMNKIKELAWEEQRQGIEDFARNHLAWDASRDKWFIHKDRPAEDRELFFGPLTGEEVFVEIDDTTNIFHILAMTGAFPSANMARKNWKNVAKKIDFAENDTTVPDGLTLFIVGKKKFDVGILK